MNIYIVGPAAAGKSTYGARIARAQGLSFVDLDAVIEQRTGRSIADIFALEGEEAFRRYEQEALHAVSRADHQVVATGGGTACYGDNMAYMKSHGRTIYLKATADTIIRHLARQPGRRPRLAHVPAAELAEHIRAEIAGREQWYNMADETVTAAE